MRTLSRVNRQSKLLFLCILRSSTAFATNHPYARAFASLTPTPTFNIRLARQSDVLGIQRCNLATLPENYQPAFYANHLKTWPELAIVAEQTSHVACDTPSSSDDPSPQPHIVGYVLGKVDQSALPRSLEGAAKRKTLAGLFSGGTSPGQLGSSNPFGSGSSFSDVVPPPAGHITSLAIMPSARRQGLANALMEQLHQHMMRPPYTTSTCGLHVRVSNTGAYRLYKDGLGYNIQETIKNYYQDGEDAYYMEKVFALCDKLGSLPSQSKQSESSRQQQRESSGQQTRAMSSSKGGADQFALPRLHQQEPAQAREPAVVQ